MPCGLRTGNIVVTISNKTAYIRLQRLKLSVSS